MTPEQRARLREAAGKATPGPWNWDAGVVPPDGPDRYADIYVDGGDTIIASFNDLIPEGRSNGIFITLAQPRNTIALLDALDAAENENETLRLTLMGAENAARIDLQRLAADECARADQMRALLIRARWYVGDALDAHEHTDGRDLLKEIDAALALQTEGRGDG